MKYTSVALVSFALMFIPGIGLSQTAPSKTSQPVWRELGLSEMRHVLGMPIRNEQGREVGEIDNLLIDTHDGRISHVVISVGGFMGRGREEGRRGVVRSERRVGRQAQRRDAGTGKARERAALGPKRLR